MPRAGGASSNRERRGYSLASPITGSSAFADDDALFHRRDGYRDRADIVTAIDDLAAFVRADVNAVARLGHDLVAAGDHRQLSRQDVINLLRRRCVGTSATTREKVRDAENQRLRAAHLGAEHPVRFVVAMVRRFV